MDDARDRLLIIAFRNSISEPNVEAGFERVRALAGGTLDYDAFRDALDGCLRDGLIREPVRLPEGALQCHWRLELTPAGVAAARRFVLSQTGESPSAVRE
jgi:hypothetical protein